MKINSCTCTVIRDIRVDNVRQNSNTSKKGLQLFCVPEQAKHDANSHHTLLLSFLDFALILGVLLHFMY